MVAIVSVRHNSGAAIAGDGQATLGEKYISKRSARKIRRIYNNQVVAGFAGGVTDAVNLGKMLEGKPKSYLDNLCRTAAEVAQSWRKNPALQKLQTMLITSNDKDLLSISSNGEVLELDKNVVAIGSGGYSA